MKIGCYVWILVCFLTFFVAYLSNVKRNVELFTETDTYNKSVELNELAAKRFSEFRSKSCSDTKYYQLKNPTNKQNYVTEESSTFLTLKTSDGVYDEQLDKCSNVAGFHSEDRVCSTETVKNCYDSKNELEENSLGEVPYTLSDGTLACKSPCKKQCFQTTPCWTLADDDITIHNRQKIHGCINPDDNESIGADCKKKKSNSMCPTRKYFAYDLSEQDSAHNILVERVYDVSLKKNSENEYVCEYKPTNNEKEVFDSYDEAMNKCKDMEAKKRCYYLQPDETYMSLDHKLDYLSCSYNENKACISKIDDSLCNKSNTYYKLIDSSLEQNSKVDHYEPDTFKEKMVSFQGKHKCSSEVPDEYKKDIACDYVTECYSATGPTKPYMNSKGKRRGNACVFDDCIKRDDSIAIKKAKDVVSYPEGAMCAIRECQQK